MGRRWSMTSGLLFDSLGKSNKFGIFWIFWRWLMLKEFVFWFDGNDRAAFHCFAKSYGEAQLLLSDFLTRLSWVDRTRDAKWCCACREVQGGENASAVFELG